jgi:hypothetical protein
MASILSQTRNGSRKKDWRKTVGRFTDDPGMQALFAEAQKIRDGDRKKARRRPTKRRRVRP